MSVNKQADSGMPDVSAHRELSPHEEEALAAGKSRWMPRIFQSYGTPIPELMASPLKTGLIFGLPAGIVGAGLGSAVGGALTNKPTSGMGALIGGLGAGGLAALAAGMDREAKNEGLEELMRRMPEGAAKRDLLADPQYQSDFLGWDNNKIVATARARYYRPTERFSKRTFDMADARARYNERHKSSSEHKDVSMSESEKQALSPASQILLNYLLRTGVVGGAIGGVGGAITSKNKLRGMARGMLMGAGTGVGAGSGVLGGLGAGSGIYFGLGGNPASYQGMQNLGNVATIGAAGGGTLGGIGGHAAGKVLADKLIGPAEDEDGNIKQEEHKKAAHALLDNTTLTLAEKMSAYAELLKQAEPAMSINVPPPTLVTSGQSAPAGAPPAAAAPSAPAPRPTAGPAALPAIGLDRYGRTPNGFKPGEGRDMSNQPSTLEVLKHLVGVGDRRSTLYDETAKRVGQLNDARLSTGKALGENVLYPAAKGISGAASTAASGAGTALGAINKARINAGNWLGENVLYPAAKGLYNAPGALKDFGKWLKPDAPPPPGLLEQLKPYAPYAAVGAGGLGALALADYLSRGKKKKRRPEPTQDEEYDMPKAANVNWYKLARERQKQKRANALIPYVAPAAKAIATVAPQVVKIPGAASTASKIPSWLLPAAGTAGGVGGIYGLSKLLGGKDPSILEQIMKSKYTPYAAAGLGAAGLLGGAAYMGSRAGKEEAKKKKPATKQADLMSAGMGGAMGAGLGGLAGGLYGALAPGHEEDPESGRRRRRSRLLGALRGLAGGAALGGLGGAALGHFKPGIPHGAADAMGMGKQLELPPPPTAAETMQSNVNRMNPMQRKLHDFIMQRNKMKAPATPDPVELAKAQAMSQSLGEEPGDTGLGPNAAMQQQMAQQ